MSIIGRQVDVLDHGFVRVVDVMGDDAAVVQAARVSTGAGTKTPEEDEKLINYLMRHRHTSPFEMVEIKLHVKLPIFVARQWIRHRTANVNEQSGRYSVLDSEFYVPWHENVCEQSKTNKQGRGNHISRSQAEEFCENVETQALEAYDIYDRWLDVGVARETSRIILPLSTYTQWYWKIDGHNLMHFLQLREDEHAQWEIRQYANAIHDLVLEWIPATLKAFERRVRRDRWAQRWLWTDEDFAVLHDTILTAEEVVKGTQSAVDLVETLREMRTSLLQSES